MIKLERYILWQKDVGPHMDELRDKLLPFFAYHDGQRIYTPHFKDKNYKLVLKHKHIRIFKWNTYYLYRGFISYCTIGGSLIWFLKTGRLDQTSMCFKIRDSLRKNIEESLPEARKWFNEIKRT